MWSLGTHKTEVMNVYITTMTKPVVQGGSILRVTSGHTAIRKEGQLCLDLRILFIANSNF